MSKPLLVAFVLPFVLTACKSTAPNAPRGTRLTLERIFQTSDFSPKGPTGHIWSADSRSRYYWFEQAGEVGLYRESLVEEDHGKLTNWSAVLEQLDAQRADFRAPAMGDTNRTGRFSFAPALDPSGSFLVGTHRNDLYRFDLESKSVRYLTEGPDPELFFDFSPDGSRLAFVRNGDLHALDLATGATQRLTQTAEHSPLLSGMADWAYEEEFGVRKSFWWSPDSRHIAYLQVDPSDIPTFPITDELELQATTEQQRYPKAGGKNSRVRLGVLDLDSLETRWIATVAQEAYLPRAGWIDATNLWYLWLNRDQNHLELRFQGLKEDQARVALTEKAPDWVNVRDEPLFLADGSFLWTAELDGWRHLYHHEASGALRKRLTYGPWQIEALYGVDEERQLAFFQATEKDLRERHVYQVPLGGGPIVRLTEEAGTHSASLSPDGKHMVTTFSSTRVPRLHTIWRDGRSYATSPGRVHALASTHLSPVEFGRIPAFDGTPLYTAMIKPPDFDPARRYPVLVYVYGGPHAQTVRNVWGGKRHLFFQYMAQEGTIVFWLDNRGSWGRGKAFEAAVYRRLGELELADQVAGVEYLRSLPYVDGERIGAYGGSYGGFMTLNCLFRAPEHFQAGVAWAPVTDWRFYDTIYTERYMDTPEDNPEGYRETAPLAHVEGLRGELFLAHGTMDNNVHFQNSVQLIDALVDAEKSFELQVYPRTRHGIGRGAASYHFYRAMADFFFRKL